jgi:hypothetical protein
LQKKWLSWLAGMVAAAAVWYGVAHGQPRQAAGADDWLAVGQTNAAVSSESVQATLPPGHESGQAAVDGTNVPSTAGTGTASDAPGRDETNRATGSSPTTARSPSVKERAGTVQASKDAASRPTSTERAAQTGSKSGSGSNSGSGSAKPPVSPAKSLGSFTIRISRDHGQLLAVKTVPIVQGESLMDYMHQYFQIETAYGDGFIVGIKVNGSWIRSQWTGVDDPSKRQPVDWFLYVNGQQAPVGAGSIVPKAGDVDVWDYHRWDPSTGK